MGTEFLLLAGAGFALFMVTQLFIPWRVPVWLMPVLLFLCAYVAHFIPVPWLVYVAASGVIPVLYMLAGGGAADPPGAHLAEKLGAIELPKKKDRPQRPPPRSRKGHRVPKI